MIFLSGFLIGSVIYLSACAGSTVKKKHKEDGGCTFPAKVEASFSATAQVTVNVDTTGTGGATVDAAPKSGNSSSGQPSAPAQQTTTGGSPVASMNVTVNSSTDEIELVMVVGATQYKKRLKKKLLT